MHRTVALEHVLRCLCDTAGPRTDQWCEENGIPIEELDRAIRLLCEETAFSGLGIV